MHKIPVYTAFSDKTHIHGWNPYKYCSQKHVKPLNPFIKVVTVSGWLVAMIAISHLILKSYGL